MNNSITLILNSTQFVYFMGVVLKWQDNAITGVFRGQRSGEMGPIYVIDGKKGTAFGSGKKCKIS